MKTKEEIKEKIISLLPELNFEIYGGNAARENCSLVYGRVEAYLDVIGIKLNRAGTHKDIVERIKNDLSEL